MPIRWRAFFLFVISINKALQYFLGVLKYIM
ncbi:hypothetical protein LMOATCC19117_1615 [Listeria monocytogenes ATCC 19117]|nr:hypothetical protein LMOATCC19117_1615 [Listeria monocytogenes ATCC 19117]